MKETLIRKIMREVHDYFKQENSKRTPEALAILHASMLTTQNLLKHIPESLQQPELPLEEKKKTNGK